MFYWFKKIINNGGNCDCVADYPISHQFPDLGPDSQITIDCIIRPAARAYAKNALVHEEADSGLSGVGTTCLGAVLVELDEFGLRFRWQPGELAKDSFLSPFGRAPLNPKCAQPATTSTK